MPDQTLSFLFPDEVPAVQTVKGSKRFGIDIMEPVIVKITGTGSLQLLLKQPLPVFLFLQHVSGEFGGEGEAVTRMPGDERLLHGRFTFPVAVHPGGVKIGEALFEEGVHHLLHLFHVDTALVVRIQQRQTHQTEAQFLFAHEIPSFVE